MMSSSTAARTAARTAASAARSTSRSTPSAWWTVWTTSSPATRKELGTLMGMAPDNYVCNCGPQSTPGGTLYDELHSIST